MHDNLPDSHRGDGVACGSFLFLQVRDPVRYFVVGIVLKRIKCGNK